MQAPIPVNHLGVVLTTRKEQKEYWTKHVLEALNKVALEKPADIQDAEQQHCMDINIDLAYKRRNPRSC